ncbi:MAG: VCBS repeat-containing protein, partial [Planctomycetota bacterium]|nr:VCBS repeat-containing protein [Planctomycetota bacterium]
MKVSRKGLARLTVCLLGLLSLSTTVHGQCDPGEIFLDGTYAVGEEPESVAIGDFDGDGIPDLVVANLVSDNVSVLIGRGNGSFAPHATYNVGDSPYSVAIGDFDDDGVLDLVVVNAGSDDVSVLLGYGDGTFASHVTYAVGNAPFSVAINDLDG